VVKYDRLVVKSGVHAVAYQACAPKLKIIKQKCSSLKLPDLGAHTQGIFEKHAHCGGSCPPLEFYGTWYQSGSFSLINVGSDFSLPALFFPFL
jgi:hypothetical protein